MLTDTKVNTIRYGLVLENTVHANPAWRALKPEYARCVPCPEGAGADIVTAGPILDYETFDIQSNGTMDYSDQTGHSIDDTFSWFIPEAKGRHDLKFGARYSHIWLSNPAWGNLQGTYQFRGTGDPEFNAVESANVSGTLHDPCARRARLQHVHARRRAVRAGQVADEARPHAERRRPLRPRSLPVRPGADR